MRSFFFFFFTITWPFKNKREKGVKISLSFFLCFLSCCSFLLIGFCSTNSDWRDHFNPERRRWDRLCCQRLDSLSLLFPIITLATCSVSSYCSFSFSQMANALLSVWVYLFPVSFTQTGTNRWHLLPLCFLLGHVCWRTWTLLLLSFLLLWYSTFGSPLLIQRQVCMTSFLIACQHEGEIWQKISANTVLQWFCLRLIGAALTVALAVEWV